MLSVAVAKISTESVTFVTLKVTLPDTLLNAAVPAGVTFTDFTVVDNNPSISFITNGRAGSMTGTFTSATTFTASSFLPGGGLCDETYTLTGTFTSPTTYTATFEAAYVGALCLDCIGYTTTISGSL